MDASKLDIVVRDKRLPTDASWRTDIGTNIRDQ